MTPMKPPRERYLLDLEALLDELAAAPPLPAAPSCLVGAGEQAK